MAYITISNSRRIIAKQKIEPLYDIQESIYKKNIYFFNKREEAILKGIRELLRDSNNFMVKYYNPIVVYDSFRYLYPESKPAYHKDSSCEMLNSNFHNIEVPIPIVDKGKEEVIKFREWYKKSNFKEDDIKDYIYKLQIAFPYVGEINPRTIEHKNSGIEVKDNYSLEELEERIDELLRAAGAYFNNNPNLQSIIRRYQKWAFLGYVSGPINNNESNLNDHELKAFLRNYDEAYKKPVKDYLEEYYKVKFNPEMSFDNTLLNQLGFKPCGYCLNEHHTAFYL